MARHNTSFADLATVRALCEGDAEAERAIDAAVLPLSTQGRPNKGNNITFPSVEDNERGTSREYTLRRLKRDRPDLAEMVIGGEMSAPRARGRYYLWKIQR